MPQPDQVSEPIVCDECRPLKTNWNGPCRHAVFRFDAESFVVVHCRPHSIVVAMTSNIADLETAKMVAKGIRDGGGHVFGVVPAGTLIAALKLVKKDFEA